MAVAVDVTTRPRSRRWSRRTVLAYGGLDILVSSAGLASSAPVTETTLADWERNYAVLARGYFLAAREVFRVLLEQGAAARSSSSGRRTRSSRARTPRRTRRPRRRRCTSPGASPRKAARTGSASTPSTRTRSSRAPASGRRTGRPSVRARTASAEDDLPAFYRGRTTLGVNVYPEDVAEAIAFLAGPALGEVDRQHDQCRRRRSRRVHAMSTQPRPPLVELAGLRRATAACRRRRRELRDRAPAPCTRSSARTARASRRWSRSSTGVVQPDEGEIRDRRRAAADRRPAGRTPARDRRHVPGADGLPGPDRRRERLRRPPAARPLRHRRLARDARRDGTSSSRSSASISARTRRCAGSASQTGNCSRSRRRSRRARVC